MSNNELQSLIDGDPNIKRRDFKPPTSPQCSVCITQLQLWYPWCPVYGWLSGAAGAPWLSCRWAAGLRHYHHTGQMSWSMSWLQASGRSLTVVCEFVGILQWVLATALQCGAIASLDCSTAALQHTANQVSLFFLPPQYKAGRPVAELTAGFYTNL